MVGCSSCCADPTARMRLDGIRKRIIEMARVSIGEKKITVDLSGDAENMDLMEGWMLNRYVPVGQNRILFVDFGAQESMERLSKVIEPSSSCLVRKEGIYPAMKNFSGPRSTEVLYFIPTLDDDVADRFSRDVERLRRKVVLIKFTIMTIVDIRLKENGINVVRLINRRDILPEV